MTGVLALVGIEPGQKEGPGVAFPKQETDGGAGSQATSVLAMGGPHGNETRQPP